MIFDNIASTELYELHSNTKETLPLNNPSYIHQQNLEGKKLLMCLQNVSICSFRMGIIIMHLHSAFPLSISAQCALDIYYPHNRP